VHILRQHSARSANSLFFLHTFKFLHIIVSSDSSCFCSGNIIGLSITILSFCHQVILQHYLCTYMFLLSWLFVLHHISFSTFFSLSCFVIKYCTIIIIIPTPSCYHHLSSNVFHTVVYTLANAYFKFLSSTVLLLYRAMG
jgi:hypothetical protein